MIRVAEVREREGLGRLLEEFNPGKGPFVVIPNWHSPTKGYGTDAQSLDWLLGTLVGEKVVVEAYDAARTGDPSRFHGLDLEEAKRHREYLREQDRLFLRNTGLGEVLSRHAASYLNVTEEVWAGRVAKASEVRKLVESRYGPVVRQELYGMVPEKLWEMSGATLINFAKIKAGQVGDGHQPKVEGRLFFSLSLKNLFGLIPVPSRLAYHGSDDQGLSRSIVDMNRVYGALFRVISVAEALHGTLISSRFHIGDPAGLMEDLGLVAISDRAVELDAFLVNSLGGSPERRHFLRMAAETFGNWDAASFPEFPREAARRLREAMRPPK